MASARRSLVIAGHPDIVRMCAAALPGDAFEVRTVEMTRHSGQGMDLGALDAMPPDKWDAFAAVGCDLLNLTRLGLMSALRSRGYRLPAIVSSRAGVPSAWRPPDNVFVDDHAAIGAGASMRHNVFVGAGAVIGAGAKLGHSVWIGARAVVGTGVTIGDGTIVASGVVLGDGLRVGRQCALERLEPYAYDIADGSFVSPHFDGVVQMQPRGERNGTPVRGRDR